MAAVSTVHFMIVAMYAPNQLGDVSRWTRGGDQVAPKWFLSNETAKTNDDEESSADVQLSWFNNRIDVQGSDSEINAMEAGMQLATRLLEILDPWP